MLAARDYQLEALHAVDEADRAGTRRPLVVHPTGTGKGHPLDTDVPTPSGWRKWGDLVPGDLVFGSDGSPTRVMAVYGRGVLPTWRVTFSDRSTVEVDPEHLWAVRDHQYRRTSREHRVLSTGDIYNAGLTFGASRRWAIPMATVKYPEVDLPIGPYTLGALIANGALSGVGTTLTTPDNRVVDLVRAEGHEVNRVQDRTPDVCPRYSLPGLMFVIRKLGLNVRSGDKFIPAQYLTASINQRIALLQGLMDGDGSAREQRRTANYHTTSPQLAQDVRELVTSLGGTATINTLARQRIEGGSYPDITVMILAPSSMGLFGTPRKQGNAKPRRTFQPRRTIVDIERVADQEIRCIAVDAPDSLYVVGRDHIVTHNTVTFCHLIARRAALGRSLVLVHRDELAQQALGKMAMIAPELETGVVKAARDQVDADVVVGSVQTLQREGRLARLLGAGPIETVIVDEAHHAPAPSWTKILTRLGCFSPYGPLTVGFTATPQRDGRSLGVWERVVAYKSIREMIFRGYLCPIIGQTVETSMDLDDVRVTGGDYQDGSLGDQLEASGAIEEIADAYVQYARDRKGIAFLPTVATSQHLARALRARGIAAEHLDGETPDEDRRLILKRLHVGDTQVVTNCAVLTEGFDESSISCVVVARPTKFHGLYVQMVGRGTRMHPGKADLLVLDVTGASQRHDLVAVVDLGLEVEPGSPKDKQGEGYQCGLCGGPCSDPAHRCRLCSRPLPVQAVLDGWTKHETCRAGATAKVDVFATSKLRWLPVEDAWCLGAGDELVLMVPTDADTYRLVSYRPGGRLETLHDQLPADWARGIGEDRAKAFGSLVKRDARWLAAPVTDAQRGRLAREGLPDSALGRVRTRGQAADLITRIQGRRAVRKLRAVAR